MTVCVRRMLRLLVAGLLLTAGLSLPSPAAAAPSVSCAMLEGTSNLGTRTLVLLVHGFQSRGTTWDDMRSSTLRSIQNARFVTFDYERVHDHWVTDPDIGPRLAQVIRCYSESSLKQGGTGKVVLVGHSMGGLAIRCALAEKCGRVAGNADRVGLVVTLGTPHRGSLLQLPHTRGAQTVAGGALHGGCLALGARTRLLVPPVRGVCEELLSLAASDAALAFIPGSDELADLPPYPASVPVHALAGDATVGWNMLFHDAVTVHDGDLVVGVESATSPSGTSSTVIDCGRWSLGATTGPGSFNALGQEGTCWHSSETRTVAFQQAVGQLVAGYVREHGCGQRNNAFEVLDAVEHVPTEGYPWSMKPAEYDGNFDRCADLSAVVLPIEGASISSAEQVMLFHRGRYVGTGTSEAWPMAALNAAESTRDAVVVDYQYLRPWDDSLAGASGQTRLTFRWDGSRVQMEGDLPEDMVNPRSEPEVSLQGFGPAFAWGDTRAEAEAALGVTFDVTEVGPGCLQGKLPGVPGVTFGIEDGLVTVAAVGQASEVGNTATTDTGLALGDPVNEIAAAYPGAVEDHDPSDFYTTRYRYSSGGRTAEFHNFGEGAIDGMQFGLDGSVGEAPCV